MPRLSAGGPRRSSLWRRRLGARAAALALAALAVLAIAAPERAAAQETTFVSTLGQADSAVNTKGDLKVLKGGLFLVESQSENWSAQSGISQRPDPKQWEPRRVGASPPDALVKLAEQAGREVLQACGINPALFSAGDGTAAREAWRQVLFGVIAPLGRIVAAELSAKFGEAVKLQWDELRASDLQGRARAFQSMVASGMELQKAAALSGLLMDE